jgi:hypothetical protein
MNIDLENREVIDPRRPNGLINSALNQLYNNIRYTTIFNAMVKARMICQNINDNDIDDDSIRRIQLIRRVVASDVSYYAPGMLEPIILDDFILEEANQSIGFLETERVIARGERIAEIDQHIGYIRGLIEIFHLELNNIQRGGRKNKSRRKNKKSRKSRKSRKQ